MDAKLRSFLVQFIPENSSALTLTMKQRDGFSRLDKIEARKNFRHFMNVLSQRAFGTAYRRFGKRLGVLPVLETSLSGRLHYHAFIENPYEDLEKIRDETCIAWQKTRWGYNEIDVQNVYSDGWLDYITKANSLDNIDVENMQRVSRV